MTLNWSSISRRHNHASLPVAAGGLKTYLNACWLLLIVDFVSSRQSRRRRTAQTTERHSLFVMSRFFSGSRNVRDQYQMGRSLPSFCFWSRTQPTRRSHAFLSIVDYPFPLGSVGTGGAINFSSKMPSAFKFSLLMVQVPSLGVS